MYKTIRYCYMEKKTVSFYCDANDTCGHITGYVACYNDMEVLIAHISDHGYYDGYILKKLDDIYRVDYDGRFEKKIEALYQLKRQCHDGCDYFCQNGEDIYPALLSYAKEKQCVVSVEFQDNALSGLVVDYDDVQIRMLIIDEDGREDGSSVIELEAIKTISVDTNDEQDLLIMYQSKSGE